MGFSGGCVVRQIDERDTFPFRVFPSPCGSPEVVRDVSDDEICPLDHPFVAAEDGVLRRHVLERGIDDLIEKVGLLFEFLLQCDREIGYDKAVSNIFRCFLRLFHASGGESVKGAVPAGVADKRFLARRKGHKNACQPRLDVVRLLKISVPAKGYDHVPPLGHNNRNFIK